MQKESRVYNDITYTVGEVWEAKHYPSENCGTIIGFTLEDTPVIETLNGSITTLTNTTWTKRKEKLKLNLYKCKYTRAFFVLDAKDPAVPASTFLQTIEVEQE